MDILVIDSHSKSDDFCAYKTTQNLHKCNTFTTCACVQGKNCEGMTEGEEIHRLLIVGFFSYYLRVESLSLMGVELCFNYIFRCV